MLALNWLSPASYACCSAAAAAWAVACALSVSARAVLELAEARVEVDVEVLLALVEAFDPVRRHLELAAERRDLALERLDLVHQLEQRLLVGDLGLDARERLRLRLDLPPHVGDLPPRLVVVEHAGVRGRARRRQRRDDYRARRLS